MIKLYNRKTGEYDIEKVAGEGAMKYLYESSVGKLGLHALVKRKIFTSLTGVFCDSSFSKGNITKFINGYDIDMSICSDNIDGFKCFNDFFIRKLKPDARPFNNDPGMLLTPGDGRVKAWMDIDIERLVQVKGFTYSLKELISNKDLALKYQGGICIILRLAPVDYHRFHFIDGGVCSESERIEGKYYSVNPIALETVANVFCKNKREYSILKSDNFGDILYVEVGATSVGSIVQTYTPGTRLERGDEKGYFKFGGSTVILFLEKGAAAIDDDIIEQTDKGFEVRVLAGEVIGKK